MARQNRCEIFDPDEISVMHCINRAVRRAMLCGEDEYSGKSYEHRRQWIKDRLIFLAAHYGIDVLGYAIMGNHLHVILRNRPDVVQTWSDEEVARRIWCLFPQRKAKDGSPAEPREPELNKLMANQKVLAEYRKRLSDISWLMRQLAEQVARLANAEDECTGRFWEGRFKSQPLLDEAAILACAAYVDLNPVRAKIAETPEQSDYTSVQDRIESKKASVQGTGKTQKSDKAKRKNTDSAASKQKHAGSTDRSTLADWLAPIYLNESDAPGPQVSQSGTRASDKGFLPLKLADYLKLVDWTGRQLASDKKGRIPANCKPILDRIGLHKDVWCELVGNFGRLFSRVAGRSDSLAKSASSSTVSQRRSHGGAALLSSG